MTTKTIEVHVCDECQNEITNGIILGKGSVIIVGRAVHPTAPGQNDRTMSLPTFCNDCFKKKNPQLVTVRVETKEVERIVYETRDDGPYRATGRPLPGNLTATLKKGESSWA